MNSEDKPGRYKIFVGGISLTLNESTPNLPYLFKKNR